MANHPIPIDPLVKGNPPHPISLCVPWGDTITIGPFSHETVLVYVQPPPFPPAFLLPIPTGLFYPGDVIGFRTAQPVIATVKMGYTDTSTGVSNTITIQVKAKCP
jgi:hypothetical protein